MALNVYMTVSNSYMPFCGITLHSMIENNPDLEINAFIVCPDLSKDNAERMERMFRNLDKATVSFLRLTTEMEEYIRKVGRCLRKGHNTTFLLRLLIADLLPKDIDKALYIDADVIISGSLHPLSEYRFKKNIGIAVVKDAVRYEDYERLNIDPHTHFYFNAGVSLINLDFWRENGIGEKCLDLICTSKEVAFMPDQDALNIVLNGHTSYLHPKYNCLTLFSMRDEYLKNRVQPEEFFRVKEAVLNPVIIHYVFVNKPWFKGGYLPKRDLWDKYKKSSPWSDYTLRYRNGWKGFVKHLTKEARDILYAFLGLENRNALFIKRRFLHIQIIALILYYGIAQWLPNFDSRFFGKISNKFRVACVKRLFDYVGSNVNIGRRAKFGKGTKIRIGRRSNIGAYCRIPNNIEIGENVMMGPRNFFFNSFTHNVSDTNRPMIDQGFIFLPGRTTLKDDIWIGQDCMFMPNIIVESHSIIGARTVVTKNVPQGVVFAGNPGKVKKSR